MKMEKMEKILRTAYENGYAVPAINVSNMETVMAVFEGAQQERSPIILQVAPIQLKIQKINIKTLVNMIREIGKNYEGVYALHLDHGEDRSECRDAIEAGFNSVMYDGSAHDLKRNTDESMKVKNLCLTEGVDLECELGKVGGTEGEAGSGNSSIYTDIDELRSFMEKVKPTSMAVAIGNAHGFYKGKPKLNFSLLGEIYKEVGCPLVLHGGTGIPEDDIKRAITLGVSKINFFSEIDREYTRAAAEYMKDNEQAYMMSVNEYAREKMKDKVRKKIEVCNSRGRL